MLTNILASVVLTFATNPVVHWPQKFDGMRPNPGYAAWAEGKHTHPYTLEYCPPEVENWVNDINADTRWVEFTVTGRKLLSFDFEGEHIEHERTNWTQAHWSVDERRVRTNVWVAVGYSNEIVHIRPSMLSFRNRGIDLDALVETNYWVPVATNAMFLQPYLFTNSTNSRVQHGKLPNPDNDYLMDTNGVWHKVK